MNFLAIDPGENGGWAFGDSGSRTGAFAMPKTDAEKSAKLREFKEKFPNGVVYLEEVGGFHRGMEGKQPGSAMFNFQ